MPRNKTLKFFNNTEADNILEPWKSLFDKIKWNRNKLYFKNSNPIVLEIACWKWEYSVWLAQIFPDKNYIWIDIKWERLRLWSQIVNKLWLTNVGFLRIIIQHLESYFSQQEVSEIRIIHPDPRPKKYDEKKRLTSLRFLEYYENILKEWWKLMLKTDDTELFQYSLETLIKKWWVINKITFNLYESNLYKDHHWIKTHYEKKFTEEWRTIKYLSCTKPDKSYNSQHLNSNY